MELVECREKRAKDVIDFKYELKKFFRLLYGLLGKDEYIRIMQSNKDGVVSEAYFNDIDDLIDFCLKRCFEKNTYFELATTDGVGGSEEHLLTRSFIGLDFDKKELGESFSHKDIINMFIESKIHYHALVDSGHGYHVYIMIKKTSDLDMVDKVQKALCERFGADVKAVKKTQLLRVPFTFNIKDRLKKVNIIKQDDRHGELFKPYDIEFLHEKNCNRAKQEKQDTKITSISYNTNLPVCIKTILDNGSVDSERYSDLCNIVVTLRNRNKSLAEIQQVCKEWDIKSNYGENTEYKVEHIFNNKKSTEFNCSNCPHKDTCHSVVLSDFEYSADETLVQVDETNMSRLKEVKRKGVKVMKANDLLVYGVLKVNDDGLYRDEIMEKLTFTKRKKVINVAMSKNTLTATLKSLEENGFINVETREGRKKFYTLKEGKTKTDLQYVVGFSVVDQCIKGAISTEELRLYNYMRYIQHKEQRENPKALKGNLLQINQVELAKLLGVTQVRVCQMIGNLLDEHLLGIWNRQPSKNNGFDFNIYRLQY